VRLQDRSIASRLSSADDCPGTGSGKLIVICPDGVLLGPFDAYADAIGAARKRGIGERYYVIRLGARDASRD
jgi:hypothetical protein